jgi:cation:H+ antiporter
MFFSSLVFGVILYFFNEISFWVGIVFVASLLFFTVLIIRQSRKENLKAAMQGDELLAQESQSPIYKSVSFLIVGVVLLKFGADYFVDGAIALAKVFSVSDRVIAVTVIAIGTSIPELATTVIAALKKEESLAVGNLIGSNIFNILAVLGISSAIRNITIDDVKILNFDYLWMIAITFVVGLFIYTLSKRQISRTEGSILFLLYIAYIYFTLV